MTEQEIVLKSEVFAQVDRLHEFIIMAGIDHEINQYIATEIIRQIKEIKESLLKF